MTGHEWFAVAVLCAAATGIALAILQERKKK